MVTIETYGTSTAKVDPRRKRAIQGFSQPGEGPTSGLIIADGGYILTSSYNFLRKPKIITVVLADGTRHVAEILGKDETRKLTLLKIDAKELPVPESIERAALRVGQWAVSVGAGYGGEQPAISVGILSALQRISGKAVQTDANTSPANYGGPLVDSRGRVIGLIVPLSPGPGTELAAAQWYDSGIGFAVPLDGLETIIERMKRGETIERGLMGVALKPASDDQRGLVIEKVAEHSPAARAELKKGDVITAVNRCDIFDMMGLKTEMGRYHAGDTITVQFTRAEQSQSVEVQLQAGPFTQPQAESGEESEPQTGPEPDSE